MINIIETTKHVSLNSRLVSINREALSKFCHQILNDGIRVPPWARCCHFFDGGEKTAAYLLVLDSINFCFWAPTGKTLWEIDLKGLRLSGYYALAAALKKAMEDSIPITDPAFLSSVTEKELAGILGGVGELQLMYERAKILRETGERLKNLFHGKTAELISAAGGSSVKLVSILTSYFPSFKDEATHNGRKVFFYKRAQLLAADLHGSFKGMGLGHFGDIDQLTAFADYKLPQVLRHLGIIRYSSELEKMVDFGQLLAPGSVEEVEIRANTIVAIEQIKEVLLGLGRPIRSYEIDWMLWNMGQSSEFKKKPYHRTVSIYY
jgi:hypothetical protein